MSSTKIRIDKTTRKIDSRIDDRAVMDEMSAKIAEICNLLFEDSSKFDEKIAFDKIFQYIKSYNRILYSQISNIVYACFNENTPEDASNKSGTMISNIEKTVAYTSTQSYIERKRRAGANDKRTYEDAEKALVKVWDHVNLAQTQYSGLKQTDEEYKSKFDKSIAPFKEELVKDMNAQLLRNCRKITDATCLGESPEIQRKRL